MIRLNFDKWRLAVLLLCVIDVALVVLQPVYAVPACPDQVRIEQPDGSVFNAHIRGDEFNNWVESTTGHSVIQNKATRVWEYGVPDAKGLLRATGVRFDPMRKTPAGIVPGLRPFASLLAQTGLEKSSGASGVPQFAPWDPHMVSGSKKLLVILVQFAGASYPRTLVTTPSGWYTTIFNATPGVKSLANYYTDNSFGALAVTPVTHRQAGNPAGIVTVTVPDAHPNYGGDIVYSTEIAWINSALAAASSFVDFPAMDANGNGVLDVDEVVVYFIVAGYEASGSGKTPSIWAHAWGGSGVLTPTGQALQSWAMNGEINDANVQHPMGVIAHEIGHSMCGLPDLYDTSYTNKGLGIYSLMSYGSWGRAASDAYLGTTPVSLDAWSREFLGWSQPRTPVSSDWVSFGPALASSTAPVRLPGPSRTPSEYFLVENRYSTGWDKGMEWFLGKDWGGGLLVLHVDTTIGTPSYNDINEYVYGRHQGVMAVRPGGGTGVGQLNDLFYLGNAVAFGDVTSPNSRWYTGETSFVEMSSVSAKSSDMTAQITVPVFTADESFETGNLTKSSWMTGGNQPWAITTGSRNSGEYAVKSGVLGDNGTGYIEVTLNRDAGKISFFRAVSSELNWDFLRFRIDGVEVGKWSGEYPWGKVSYDVSAGTHTYRWDYTKDGSVSSGYDAAWIDDITFPSALPVQSVLRQISINVILGNWVKSTNTSIPFHIQLRNTGTLQAWSWDQSLPVVSGGVFGTTQFSIGDLAPGIYEVWAKADRWLAAKKTGVNVTAENSLGSTLNLNNGDINNDNTVNFSDYLVLQTNYKKTPPPSPTADLNGDAAVNFSDYLILQAGYKQSGATF